jgi:ribosomal protein L32
MSKGSPAGPEAHKGTLKTGKNPAANKCPTCGAMKVSGHKC